MAFGAEGPMIIKNNPTVRFVGDVNGYALPLLLDGLTRIIIDGRTRA